MSWVRGCLLVVGAWLVLPAADAEAQTVTYRGYARSGTLYGCMFAPKTNQGDWGIVSTSATWRLGTQSGTLAFYTSEYSTWSQRRWTWQTGGRPPAGATVTITVVFRQNYSPYSTVTSGGTLTLPATYPNDGTTNVLYCW